MRWMMQGRNDGFGRVRDGARGFTLLELMMGMVIVGLLAALAVPRLHAMRENAFVATMKSDIRNFSQSEESYFYDHAVYTSSMANLENNGFQASERVMLTIAEATATGWAVIADHQASSMQCALFIGTAAPVGPATTQGRIDCS